MSAPPPESLADVEPTDAQLRRLAALLGLRQRLADDEPEEDERSEAA